MEHPLPPEVNLDSIIVYCETRRELVELPIDKQRLKLGDYQIVECPCNRESFSIGLRNVPKPKSTV